MELQSELRPSAAVSAIERIAKLVRDSMHDRFLKDSEVFRSVLARGVPTPVLSVARANQLENAWTNYLAHMLDRGASRGVGAVVGPAVFEALTGKPVSPDQLHVLTEVSLGLACNHCGHSCRIDLILLGPEDLVAIEQKVVSPPSNWKCKSPDLGVHRQLNEYERLLAVKAKAIHSPYFPGTATQPTIHPYYLTRAGQQETGWRSVTHAELSKIVGAAATGLHRMGERLSLFAMLIDWNSEPFGRWPIAIEQLESLLRRTEEKSPTVGDLIWYGNFLSENKTLCDLLTALGDEK